MSLFKAALLMAILAVTSAAPGPVAPTPDATNFANSLNNSRANYLTNCSAQGQANVQSECIDVAVGLLRNGTNLTCSFYSDLADCIKGYDVGCYNNYAISQCQAWKGTTCNFTCSTTPYVSGPNQNLYFLDQVNKSRADLAVNCSTTAKALANSLCVDPFVNTLAGGANVSCVLVNTIFTCLKSPAVGCYNNFAINACQMSLTASDSDCRTNYTCTTTQITSGPTLTPKSAGTLSASIASLAVLLFAAMMAQ